MYLVAGPAVRTGLPSSRKDVDTFSLGTLIFHDGSLGDVLLSLVCLTAIRRQGLPTDIVCRSDAGALLRSSGLVRNAFSADSGVFSSWYTGHPVDAAREFAGRYGRTYVFTRRADSGLSMGLARAIPDRKVIITVPPEGDRTHMAEFRRRQLPSALGDVVAAQLSVGPAIRQQAREFLARSGLDGRALIVLHPGSGGKYKCWPLDRYFALAERLAERAGAFILFLAGPAEAGATTARIEDFARDRERMGCISGSELSLVAALLSRCELFIGNDSGVSHLAAAMGAPVTALFGPTDPALWAPVGGNVRVIAAGALEDISVNAVLEAAEGPGSFSRLRP